MRNQVNKAPFDYGITAKDLNKDIFEAIFLNLSSEQMSDVLGILAGRYSTLPDSLSQRALEKINACDRCDFLWSCNFTIN